MPKRLKCKSLNFIPRSYNFSEVFPNGIDSDDENQFDIGDMGEEVEQKYEQMALEKMVIEILHNLDDREKIIFLLQILRDDGYNLDHDSCASILHIQRQWYMTTLSKVRTKIKFMVKNRKTKK
jgi:DNA-directed RNA polymerase specialized sigma subunit